MSYNGVDDGDVADSLDGIDEEYPTADDANLDEYDMVSRISTTNFIIKMEVWYMVYIIYVCIYNHICMYVDYVYIIYTKYAF